MILSNLFQHLLLENVSRTLSFVRSPNILNCFDKQIVLSNVFGNNNAVDCKDVNDVFEALRQQLLVSFSTVGSTSATTLEELENAFANSSSNSATLLAAYKAHHSGDAVPEDQQSGLGSSSKKRPSSSSARMAILSGYKKNKRKKARANFENKVEGKTVPDYEDLEEIYHHLDENRAEQEAKEKREAEEAEAQRKKQEAQDKMEAATQSKKQEAQDKKQQEKEEKKKEKEMEKRIEKIVKERLKDKDQEIKELLKEKTQKEGELNKNFQKQIQELQRRKEDNSTDRESIRRLNDLLAAKEMDLQEANDLNAKNSESLNRVVSIYYNCFFANVFVFKNINYCLIYWFCFNILFNIILIARID